MSEDKLEDKIKENAVAPKSVDIDGQKIEQHSLDDQMEADRYLNSKKALKKQGLGLRSVKMIPPGAG